MGRALVLNASYQPLCVVAVRRALVLALKGKAEILETNGAVFRSEALEIQAFAPDAIPWPEIAFRTTFYALADWVAARRPELPAPTWDALRRGG